MRGEVALYRMIKNGFITSSLTKRRREVFYSAAEAE